MGIQNTCIFSQISKLENAKLSISFKKVLKREPSGFLGLISAFVVLKFLTELLGEKRIEIKSVSLIFLALGFIVYSILRYLSKKTKILEPNY